GAAVSAYWNTELCTLTDIAITSEESTGTNSEEAASNEADITNAVVVEDNGIVKYTVDKVVLDNTGDITIVDNPLYNVDSDKITINYTVNMTEGTAQNGWDGLFAFYNTVVETDTLGRVSVQSAPYICYNDWSGNYLDINKPDLDGAVNMAPSMTAGTEHEVSIVITADELTMTVDGEELSYPVDGTGTYEGMLDYITSCDKFTWGVGSATSSFWNTELCTITDVVITNGDVTVIEDDEVPTSDNPGTESSTNESGEDSEEDSNTTVDTSSETDSSADTSTTEDNTAASTEETTDNSSASTTSETVTGGEAVESTETTVAATGVTLNKKSIKIGKKGTYQLVATVLPENATNKNVTFKIANSKIAKVDANGLVTAKKIGTTTITVTTEDGKYTATCKVKVTKQVKVTSVKLNKSKKTLKVGKTYQLKATVKPKNATVKTVTYKSSNSKVASVDSNGKVTAKKTGTATITVKTKDGKYTAKCKITVK
ncbi:MAG: Ig-like domain-containing protein, partial [Butyrivibrio sp.]|nr:Ig-like domain-containing protein [Butyrivibrio sp.]